MKGENNAVILVETDIQSPEERVAAAFQRLQRFGRVPWRPRCRPCPVPAHEIRRQRAEASC